MRYPIASCWEHIVWSHYGGAVAVYRVNNVLSYTHLSNAEKEGWMETVRRALASQRSGVYQLLSVCEPTDPDLLADVMNRGTGVAATEGWAEFVRQYTAAMDADEDSWQRHFYVIPQVASAHGSTSLGRLASAAGYLPRPPTQRHRERAMRSAAAFQRDFDNAGITLQPATPQELRWLYVRAAYRGAAKVTLNGISPHNDAAAAPVVNAKFAEGGIRTDLDRPGHRRFLRIETEAGVSYQTFLCASRVPLQWAFPDGGGEWWLGIHGRFKFPVDWSALIIPTDNREASKTAQKQIRRLRHQFAEYRSDVDIPPSLNRGLESAEHLRRRLSETGDPELRISMTFSLAADTLAALEDHASDFRQTLQSTEWAIPRPIGVQKSLYLHMLPGGPHPRVLREYAQFYLPDAAASGMPWAQTDVGDPQGQLLGYNVDSWAHRPVLFDAAYGPTVDRSPSVAAFGTLGSGKSFAIKQLAYGTVHRGGRVVAIDRTNVAEYVNFSEAFPDHYTQVVRVDRTATFSMDPARVFDTIGERVRFTVGFLVSVLGVKARSEEAALIEDLAEQVIVDGGPVRRIVDLLHKTAQQGTGDSANAAKLHRQLSQVARDEYAQVVFGEGREPLKLNGRWVVFSLAGLPLPSEEQLTNATQAADITREQFLGQGLLYLIAAMCRKFCLDDPGEFTAALFDEAWAFTRHQGGKALVSELVRDGRKHNAAIWLLSQHPDDLGDVRTANLIGYRFLFRQGDGAGTAALQFCGVKDPSQAQVRMVETLETGICMLRDVRGRVGLVRVKPVDQASYTAAQTTPEGM